MTFDQLLILKVFYEIWKNMSVHLLMYVMYEINSDDIIHVFIVKISKNYIL